MSCRFSEISTRSTSTSQRKSSTKSSLCSVRHHRHCVSIIIEIIDAKGLSSSSKKAALPDQLEIINAAKKWSHYFARHYPVSLVSILSDD